MMIVDEVFNWKLKIEMSLNLRDFLKGYCRELLVGFIVKKCDYLLCLYEWGRIEVC